MGQKRKTPPGATPAQDFGQTSVDALEQSIRQDAAFFDSCVELIPARFYLAPEENQQQGTNTFKKNKRKNAEIKEEKKHAAKLAKKAKLDPENEKTTAELQRERKDKDNAERGEFLAQIAKNKVQQERAEDTIEPSHPANGAAKGAGLLGSLLLSTKNHSDDAEKLKEKLQQRIKELQANRTARDHPHKQQRGPKKEEKKDSTDTPKQPQPQNGNKRKAGSEPEKDTPSKKKGPAAAVSSSSLDEDPSFAFSTFDFQSGKPVPSYLLDKQRKKKRSNTDEALLKKAEQEKLLMSEIKDTEEGKALLQKKAWEKALKKAEGEKVKDDPKLLKKTIKAKQKKKEKSAAKWQDRLKLQKKQQAVKQQKRQENIRKYRMNKSAISEDKKKTQRAGFEGKKQGFLNKERQEEA